MSGADRHRPALALAPALHVAVGKRRWVGPAPLCALLFALLSVVAVGADPATAGEAGEAGATVASSTVASAAGVPAPGFRFTDVSADAGLTGLVYSSESAHSLGVNWVDIDNDGWVDLFAVGGAPEHPPRLFRNLSDGTFEPARHLLPRLPATDMSGSVFADYDNDGDLDIYVYTDNSQWVITRENQPDGPPNLLLHNRLVENGGVIVPGEPLFREAASLAEVDDQASPPFGKLSGHRTKAAAWLDYDRDGCIDLYIGHLVMNADHARRRGRVPVRQQRRRYLYQRGRTCRNRHRQQPRQRRGRLRSRRRPGHRAGQPHGLPRTAGQLQIQRLRGARCLRRQRAAVLATVAAQRLSQVRQLVATPPGGDRQQCRGDRGGRTGGGGGQTLMRQVVGGTGGHSQSSLVVHFGLGPTEMVDAVEVLWPSGLRTRWADQPANRLIEVVEGAGCQDEARACIEEPSGL